MGAVTRRFCLTKASTRWIALAVSTLMLGTLAIAARADAYIYFGIGSLGSIARFDSNGSGGLGRYGFIQHLGDGVAVNSNHIFWTNEPTDTIGRANLDGTNANPNFITGASFPFSVAANDRFIYWTNSATGSIGRARVNGNAINQNFIPSLGSAVGIAIDDQHIYWTGAAPVAGSPSPGTNAVSPSIGRANLNGTAVNPSFIKVAPGDGAYTGVAVGSKYVYWTNDRGSDGSSGAVSRASLDGDDIDLDFIAPIRDDDWIAVDVAHIYWGNVPVDADGTTTRPAIGRANLDGTQADPLWLDYGVGDVYCCATQIAVNALPATCAGSDATIAGTRGSDRLRATKDDDVIAAMGGNDTVGGLAGDDLVCGGRGDDELRGQGGDDTLKGGRGKDELRGGGGSNKCRGGKGSDSKDHC